MHVCVCIYVYMCMYVCIFEHAFKDFYPTVSLNPFLAMLSYTCAFNVSHNPGRQTFGMCVMPEGCRLR